MVVHSPYYVRLSRINKVYSMAVITVRPKKDYFLMRLSAMETAC